MILNGLGFSNRRLYLVPQFLADKPVETLLGPGITANDLKFQWRYLSGDKKDPGGPDGEQTYSVLRSYGAVYTDPGPGHFDLPDLHA